MNANNFFTPTIDDGLNRKQFGGTFGGPIVKNRTFFFGSYQGTLQEQRPADRTSLVPHGRAAPGQLRRLHAHAP